MNLICRRTGTEFQMSRTALDLCKKLEVPLPTLCPEERMRDLTGFINYHHLYRARCAKTREDILSIYHPSVPFPVYSVTEWWSESWNGRSYGEQYDFSQSFFTQLHALRSRVPHPALSVNYTSLENSNYVNSASYCKNCYLLFSGAYCEDCYFCFGIWRSRDCIDCNSLYDCELCYESTQLTRCYDVRYGFNSQGCRESAFLWNCIGCDSCVGCVNLWQQRFCWFNSQLSEKEYQEKLKTLNFTDADQMAGLWKEFFEFAQKHPQPAIRGVQHENVSGDFLHHAKNVEQCFDCAEVEDCVNCIRLEKARDCMDVISWGLPGELLYCCSRIGYDSSRLKFCYTCYLNAFELEYCINCINSKHCFGCVGLRGAEYCILNQQLTRAEYEKTRKRIVAQMSAAPNPEDRYGEYLPSWLSFVPYNESMAQLIFPLSRSEVKARGLWWVEENQEIEQDSAPNSGVRHCKSSGRPFRITERERRIYEQRQIPTPSEHWYQRIVRRENLKNPPQLFEHHLNGKHFLSSFPPLGLWQVLPAEDYQRLVAGGGSN